MSKVEVGNVYGRLTVLELLPDGKNPKARCACSCGAETRTQRGALKSGKAKSCGCLRVERFTALVQGRPKMSEEEARRRARESAKRNPRKDREARRAASRRFYQNHKGKVKSYHHARRAALRAAPGSVSATREQELLTLQGWKCAACRACLRKEKRHMDHIDPISRGGSNDDRNIQLLCATCNLQKGAKNPVDFMQSKGYLL